MNLKDQKVTRQLQADVQQENSQVVFSFASEVPYLRQTELGDYYQILKCQPQYCDTSRLNDGACQLLLDHDWQRSIGVCKKYWFADKKLYASIKFSRSNFAQGIKRDVLDQIRRNVSIGYIVRDYKVVEPIDGIKTIEITDWQPYQLTICSVPADYAVGYKRSLDDSTNEEIKQQKGQAQMNAQTDKTTSATERAVETAKVEETDRNREDQATIVEDVETKSEESTEVEKEKVEETKAEVCPECGKDPCECEQKACGEEKPQEKSLEVTPTPVEDIQVDFEEIRSLGELTNEIEVAKQFIAQKKSLEDFKLYLKTKNSTKSKNSIQDNNTMNTKYFSISKAIRNACSQYKADVSQEYETLVNEENKRSFGVEDADIVLSNKEMHQRLLSGTVNGVAQSPGGELIHTDYLPQEFVTYLRPQLTLEKTGYYSIPVNGNAVQFAVCTGGVAAGMYDLDGVLTDSDMQFTVKTLAPKKAGACVPIPYSLILQGRPEVDAMVENDIVNALYQKRDEQILIGTGNDGECLGILNTTGINEVSATLSTDAWGACLSGINEIRKKNIFSENLSFVMNGDTYVKLSKTMKDANNCFAGFVIEDDKIKNYPVYVNNAITGDIVLVGDFGQVAVADFQGLKLKVDDITYIKRQAIQVVAIKSFDCVVRRTGAFTKITFS